MGNIQLLQPQQKPGGIQRSCRSMPTHELLAFVGKEIHHTLAIIGNMQRNRHFDDNARAYFCNIMRVSEQKLCIFNQDMVGESQFPDREQRQVEGLKQEVRKLRDKNDSLEKENKSVNQLLQEILSKTQSDGGNKSVPSKRAPVPAVMGVNEPIKTDVNPSSIKGRRGGHDKLVDDLQYQLGKRDDDIKTLSAANESSQAYIKHLSKRTEKLETENKKLQDEKENLAVRLSKVAGQKLVQDNPDITDLSDSNRPTKLGEFYSEVYDNEWTDALEALMNCGYDEKDAIITLRLTLINVLEFCKNKSETLLKKTEDAMNVMFEEFKDSEEQKKDHLKISRSQSQQWLKQAHDSSFDDLPDELVDLQERWRPKDGEKKPVKGNESVKVKKSDVVINQLKIFRKEVAESMIPIVQKAYISASWKDTEFIAQLKPFIKKCIFLGWMMVVQSPPMALATCAEGVPFDKNMFKEYTKIGPKVNYVVWPALLLHENGPILGRGVAEGRKA